MARICWAIVFIFLGLTPSFGRQCVLPGGGDDKPALSGAVEDDAKELGFVWQSRAYKNPNWEIENRICNDGKSNLIVSWPKTDLFATAYRPLKSGNSLLNSYSVLAEPTAGSSEITYGYVGTTTSAKHYETKAAAVTLPRLNSRIEAVLVSEEKPSENFVVAFYFEASPKDGSYEFKFYPKTPAARFFTVGFSSSQNKLFAEAFQQQKKKMFVGSLGQVSKLLPAGWEKLYGPTEYVFVGPQGNYEPVTITLPVTPKRVEVARAILLDVDRNPIAAGRVTLFGQ